MVDAAAVSLSHWALRVAGVAWPPPRCGSSTPPGRWHGPRPAARRRPAVARGRRWRRRRRASGCRSGDEVDGCACRRRACAVPAASSASSRRCRSAPRRSRPRSRRDRVVRADGPPPRGPVERGAAARWSLGLACALVLVAVVLLVGGRLVVERRRPRPRRTWRRWPGPSRCSTSTGCPDAARAAAERNDVDAGRLPVEGDEVRGRHGRAGAPARTRAVGGGPGHPVPCGAGGPPGRPSSSVEQPTAAGLVQRVVAVAALRRLDARRAAALAPAARDRLAGGRQPLPGAVVAALGEAGAARVAVVDEDGQLAGVGVQRRRDAADVPPVAGGEQRQEADRGVLGGVRGTGQVGAPRARPVEDVRWHRPPDGAGLQHPLWQVERLLAEHLAGRAPPSAGTPPPGGSPAPAEA